MFLHVLNSLSVCRYFCEVDVCKYRPNWYSARMEGRLLPYASSQYTLLTFEAPSTVEVDISLYQPSLRWEDDIAVSTLLLDAVTPWWGYPLRGQLLVLIAQ